MASFGIGMEFSGILFTAQSKPEAMRCVNGFPIDGQRLFCESQNAQIGTCAVKFNHFQEELKKWESHEKNTAPATSPVAIEFCDQNKPKIPLHKTLLRAGAPTKERVVSGEIKWKPIDRPAAMLLAKAHWLSQPAPDPKPEPEPPKPRKIRRMGQSPKNFPGNVHPAIGPDTIVSEKKSDEQFNAELSTHMIKKSAAAITSSSELLDKAIDARAAMDVMCEQWKVSWLDFQDTCNDRLKELRMTRMAIDTEMRQLMAGCREVRQFFLDKDYELERARLKEFVEVCERLKALKESGFLDSVAETMLKLSP